MKFPRNPLQLNISFLPSSVTSLKALISFPKGNRKSMKTSTSKVSQVLQRGNRKSINSQQRNFYGNICKSSYYRLEGDGVCIENVQKHLMRTIVGMLIPQRVCAVMLLVVCFLWSKAGPEWTLMHCDIISYWTQDCNRLYLYLLVFLILLLELNFGTKVFIRCWILEILFSSFFLVSRPFWPNITFRFFLLWLDTV